MLQIVTLESISYLNESQEVFNNFIKAQSAKFEKDVFRMDIISDIQKMCQWSPQARCSAESLVEKYLTYLSTGQNVEEY